MPNLPPNPLAQVARPGPSPMQRGPLVQGGQPPMQPPGGPPQDPAEARVAELMGAVQAHGYAAVRQALISGPPSPMAELDQAFIQYMDQKTQGPPSAGLPQGPQSGGPGAFRL